MSNFLLFDPSISQLGRQHWEASSSSLPQKEGNCVFGLSGKVAGCVCLAVCACAVHLLKRTCPGRSAQRCKWPQALGGAPKPWPQRQQSAREASAPFSYPKPSIWLLKLNFTCPSTWYTPSCPGIIWRLFPNLALSCPLCFQTSSSMVPHWLLTLCLYLPPVLWTLRWRNTVLLHATGHASLTLSQAKLKKQKHKKSPLNQEPGAGLCY